MSDKKGIFDKEFVYPFIREYIFFCLAGMINLAVYMGLYNLLLVLSIHYLVANAVGFLASTVCAYYLNKVFVFRNKDKKQLKSFLKTFFVYVLTFAAGELLLAFYVDTLNVAEEIAPLINTTLFTPVNFVLNKYWAFKKSDVDAGKDAAAENAADMKIAVGDKTVEPDKAAFAEIADIKAVDARV